MIAFVYDGASRLSAPHLLGKFGENRYFRSLKSVWGGNVRLYGEAVNKKAPRCCPDLIVSQTYRWGGATLRRTAETVNPIS